MTTHSRMADLALRLSGRLAQLGQGRRAQQTETSFGVGAFQFPIRTTALCSSPIRTTAPTNPPMARRRLLSTVLHITAVFAVAAALSGAAANVAAARGGVGGGGHGGGFGGSHVGGIGSDFVAGSGGGFGGSHIGGFEGSPVGGFAGSHIGGFGGAHIGGLGGSFGGRLGYPSGGGFRSPSLAINSGRFASPSALVETRAPAMGTRLNMHYRGHHRPRYYTGDCLNAAGNPYQCEPNGYCPCSTVP
jgi:hypothetical protein